MNGTPGVAAALVAMATELNLALAADLGFAAPDGATANDLLVAIDAADDAVPAALATLDAELDRPAGERAGLARAVEALLAVGHSSGAGLLAGVRAVLGRAGGVVGTAA